MTRDGVAYELPTSAPRTAGFACSSLLPTPTTEDHGTDAPGRTGGASLSTSFVTELLPTPRALDTIGPRSPEAHERHLHRGGSTSRRKRTGNLSEDIVDLLPTPRATDGTKGGPNQRGSSGDLMLPSAVHHLLPTPTSTDHKASGSTQAATDTHHVGTTLTDATVRQPDQWGDYAPAIARWEAVTGHPAPSPTEPGRNGTPRLSPKFVEWMMGLEPGHITDVDITRSAQLKAGGNGVVPRQAEAAIRHLLAVDELEAVAS